MGTLTLQGVELEASQRLRANVTAGAYVSRTWAGKLEAGTRVKVSW